MKSTEGLAPGDSGNAGRAFFRRHRGAAVVAIGVTLGAALGLAVINHRQSVVAGVLQIRPTGIPSAVPTSTANLMGLSPVPARPAPGFVLTDQHGATIPLERLRGKVVVLEAMDPHCTDICPLVSSEFIDAYHDLGARAADVVFAALNVNQYFARPGDVAAFSADHGLTTIPSWHFFTGSPSQLHAAWAAYGIQVSAPDPKADIIHTSVLYFIDRRGLERYVATPMVDHTASGATYLPAGELATWGRGIALTVRGLEA